MIEEARAEYIIDENVPPPPEEPPDEFSSVNRRPSTVGSEKQNARNDPPPANENQIVEKQNGLANGNGKSNGGNGDKANFTAPAAPATRFQPPKHLRIFLQRTNDYDEDVRRMRELLMLLSSVDGHDRFTFYVPNPQGVVQLDFPNHSTSYAQVQVSLDELMSEWGTLEIQ
jgi:DNA polymerase-3 subunit alpha